MIDDSDVEFAILAAPSGGGWFAGLLALLVICALAFAAHKNRVEYEQKRCDRGVPMLAEHECLCVEAAK